MNLPLPGEKSKGLPQTVPDDEGASFLAAMGQLTGGE